MKDTKTALVLSGVLGGAIIISSLVAGYAFFKVRSLDNVLSVTGSAKTQVVSDQVKWSLNIARTVKESQLKAGYASLAADLTALQIYLAGAGVAQEEITVAPVFTSQIYDYNNQNVEKEREYSVEYQIKVASSDVQKIANAAKDTQSLIEKGVIIRTSYLEYFYSDLADLRVKLLGDAVVDARARAEEIAKSDGKKVGTLRAASSGVVQVLQKNSIEISDYGAYDTSSIEKDVMVTVKASFSLK